jgi:hypothetical protein
VVFALATTVMVSSVTVLVVMRDGRNGREGRGSGSASPVSSAAVQDKTIHGGKPITSDSQPVALNGVGTGFCDNSTEACLQVELDPTSKSYGMFTLTIPGTGLVWGTGKAIITTRSGGPVKVTYNGESLLSAGASLDTAFAMKTRPAGPLQSITTRLTADLTARVHSGTVDVSLQGQRFHLNATGTTSTPAKSGPPGTGDARQVVADWTAAMSTHHWATAYRYASQTMRQGLTEKAFVDSATTAYGSSTKLTLRATGQPTYVTNAAGISSATVALVMTTTKAGATTTKKTTLNLVLEPGGWRCLSTT